MIPRYYIWLMPVAEIYALLAATIAELGRKHAASIFGPHVTLLGDLPGSEEEIAVHTSHLARQLKPYDIHLTTPAYEDQYFRCLFLNVQETPVVMEANARGKMTFNQPDEPPYKPHLSLLYGSYPVPLKTQIIATLPSFQGVHFSVTTLHVIRVESTDPKDWHKICAFPLNG
jgi:2'-5' RNA ligase